jgi:Methylase involved in ubiquinone/menaquinone biosynthesis
MASNSKGQVRSKSREKVVTTVLYTDDQVADVPAEAVNASLGSGNPVEFANLQRGETVLDLGSGGGLDVILAAGKIGPLGKVYGLDMTEEMLDLAKNNQTRTEIENAEFIKGDLENVPLADQSVDVIISNCVINLCENKGKALSEAYRVLRCGGRLAVSDVVTDRDISEPYRTEMLNWVGCINGALTEDEYRSILKSLGFTGITVEETKTYDPVDAEEFLQSRGLSEGDITFGASDGRVFSALIKAFKP